MRSENGPSVKQRENCGRAANGTDWCICAACGGRIHNPGCTTKRNKQRDCCPERHKMLHDQGRTTWNGGNEPMYVEGQTW